MDNDVLVLFPWVRLYSVLDDVFFCIPCPDGELYAGISSDFMSRDSAFFRSLGSRHVIRTEQYDSSWLQSKDVYK